MPTGKPNELFLKSIVPEIHFVPISQGLPLRVPELSYDCGCTFVVLDVSDHHRNTCANLLLVIVEVQAFVRTPSAMEGEIL